MTLKERNDFINAFLDEHCFKIMITKGTEYSRGEFDVNSNFKRLAKELDINEFKVLWVFLKKHLDSIAYFCKVGDLRSNESIESRIGDAVNYLLILASLIHETADVNYIPDPLH